MNKAVDGLTVLEAAKQRRQTIGLVIQGEHHLMHKSKSSPAGLSWLTILRNPILKDGQLHGLGSIRPKVIGNRICVALSRPKMRIHTSSLGLAVSTHICNQQKDD
jgi:hypothetical protein